MNARITSRLRRGIEQQAIVVIRLGSEKGNDLAAIVSFGKMDRRLRASGQRIWWHELFENIRSVFAHPM